MQQDQAQLVHELYLRYARWIRDWAFRHTGNMECAENIMQEAFLVLSVKIDAVMEHKDPTKWLFRTAKNILLHTYRDMQREAAYLAAVDTDAKTAWYEPEAGLWELLPPSLRPQDRRLLTMYYEEHYSIKEIADVLGISSSACKMRLLRLREELKKILDRTAENRTRKGGHCDVSEKEPGADGAGGASGKLESV